jgi:aryl-phospho-beta-D-glucosidase BglC (GH1 family)
VRATKGAAPAPALLRGVNIHHMLNWPAHENGVRTAGYVWPPFDSAPYQLSATTLEEIVGRGFTFVRLTVDPSIFLAAGGPRRAELADIVMSRVDRFLAAGLEVVIDLHPVDENPAFPVERLTAENSPDTKAYTDTVQAVARELGRRPANRVALQLMNEPHPEDRDGPERWQKQQARLYEAARRSAPDLAVIVCGANWSSGHELTKLDLSPYRKGNVLFTFHYYEPHVFTHAGMPGAVPEYYVEDLVWPPNPAQANHVTQATVAEIAADPKLSSEAKTRVSAQARGKLGVYFSEVGGQARITRDFDEVAEWATTKGVPPNRILLGEFGAYYRAHETPEARTARLAWLQAVRRAAEQRSFGWAVWVLLDVSGASGGIGILPPNEVKGMDPGVVNALGLRAS